VSGIISADVKIVLCYPKIIENQTCLFFARKKKSPDHQNVFYGNDSGYKCPSSYAIAKSVP